MSETYILLSLFNTKNENTQNLSPYDEKCHHNNRQYVSIIWLSISCVDAMVLVR